MSLCWLMIPVPSCSSTDEPRLLRRMMPHIGWPTLEHATDLPIPVSVPIGIGRNREGSGDETGERAGGWPEVALRLRAVDQLGAHRVGDDRVGDRVAVDVQRDV